MKYTMSMCREAPPQSAMCQPEILADRINLSNVSFTCSNQGRPGCPPAFTKLHEIKRDHASESLLRIIACYTSVEIKHDCGLGTVELGGPEHCLVLAQPALETWTSGCWKVVCAAKPARLVTRTRIPKTMTTETCPLQLEIHSHRAALQWPSGQTTYFIDHNDLF